MHVSQRLNDTPRRNVCWDTKICDHLRPRRPGYASWCWRGVMRLQDRGSAKGNKSDEQEARRKGSRRSKYTHENHGTGDISEVDEGPTTYSSRQRWSSLLDVVMVSVVLSLEAPSEHVRRGEKVGAERTRSLLLAREADIRGVNLIVASRWWEYR
jgi:hypothetical protein